MTIPLPEKMYLSWFLRVAGPVNNENKGDFAMDMDWMSYFSHLK